MRKLQLLVIALCVALTAACLPTWALPPDNTVPVPAHIDATGASDVTDAFAAFLASVPDGSVIDFPSGARYRMEETIYVDNRNSLTFRGNGAEVFATTQGDRNRANFRIRGGSSIVFRDITVRGANPHGGKDGPDPWSSAREAQHAWDALGVTGFALINVTATDTHGDFVHMSIHRGTRTNDVLIKDSHFERSGRQGIAIVAAHDVTIENNTLTDLRRATFDIEPEGASGGVHNVVIRNNHIGPGRLMFVAAAGKGPANNVTVEGNTLSGQAMQVFLISKNGGRRSDWTIRNNTSDLPLNNPHQSAMRIWRVDGLTIEGNQQPFTKNRQMVLANVDRSCDVTIEGNTLTNAISQARITQPTC